MRPWAHPPVVPSEDDQDPVRRYLLQYDESTVLTPSSDAV
jgi:hypothetical protein